MLKPSHSKQGPLAKPRDFWKTMKLQARTVIGEEGGDLNNQRAVGQTTGLRANSTKGNGWALTVFSGSCGNVIRSCFTLEL